MKTILFVEDDSELLESLTDYFSKYAQVFSAQEGQAALTILKQNSIDVVLTDLNMPNGMSGFELINEINKAKPEGLKVYVLSGQEDNKTAKLAVDGYFAKPVGVKDLKTHLLGVK